MHHLGAMYHMGAIAMCTLWEAEGPIWELSVDNWSHMQWITLYWSHMAIRELCTPYVSHIHHMRRMASYGGRMQQMGAMQKPCVSCGSYLHHIGGGWCHMGATNGSLMQWMRAIWRHEPSVQLENQV
jgi:hypothetical protein